MLQDDDEEEEDGSDGIEFCSDDGGADADATCSASTGGS